MFQLRQALFNELTKAPNEALAALLILESGARSSEVLKRPLTLTKHGANTILIIESLKGSDHRTIALSPEVAALAYPLRAQSLETKISGGERSFRRFFNRVTFWTFGESVNVHALRHSYAMAALDAGGNIIEVQQLMGHKSINSTAQYLKHRNNEQLGAKVLGLFTKKGA
jgi:integrase